MDSQSKNVNRLSALPPALAEAAAGRRLAKRERTRRQVIAAAIGVLTQRGSALATMQEIAAAADVAPATLYNHFRTKDDLLQGVALHVAETLCRRIAESYAHVRDAAERMAIGNRRYIWLAEQSPGWALLVLDIGLAVPPLAQRVTQDARADLRLGLKQKRFRVASEAAAMDLISGTVSQAMRSVALGLAPARHDVAVAATVLRGLGMAADEALALARRPLPEFPAAG
ncbi:transcriptional regulator, TetR family [Rhodospirillales bacterium URHD0017]|nr:transcriptional regulator, TetR family [Rhodospirillales bacterium URHD0017]